MRDGLAERLLALADRVDRLKPLNHDPEAFFVERDEIQHALVIEARALLRPPTAAPAERGRFETGAIVVKGRTVRAERRRSLLRKESAWPSNRTNSSG